MSTGILGNADYFSSDYRETYVRISDDKMQAFLYLAQKNSGMYTKEELIGLLSQNGVIFGVNQSALVAMTKKEVYNREILVATGNPPEVGMDGYYEFTFDISAGGNKPVIREDGSADYQSMRAVTSVPKDSLLATYHHAIPGKNGKDVTGKEIPVPIVKELTPANGKDVYQAQNDPDKYYAGREGKVEFSNGKLNIVNVLEFNGDVDQLTGKIEFHGDIHIQGNVEAGTVIRAGKTLTIDGTVEAADLTAGGDIILKRGIQGSQKAHIICSGSLYADFLEHTFVKVEGDVMANYVLSSYINANGKVILTGKRASLIGGNTYARSGVKCNTLGNNVNIKTKVSTGVSPEMSEESDRLQRELKESRAKIQKIRSEVTEIGAYLSPEQQDEYKLTLQQEVTKQQNILDEQKKVFEHLEAARNSSVAVEDMIYAGAEICIDGNWLKFDKNNRSMEYRNVGGMITGKVIVYH
ncbi:MAG: FapA family protein [Lachnospiraceae bacterium]|nr:FapA family protein [Lachnospiraceae bacterium]